jgi:23S rRNA (cytosine1962-C5)-methyltransferase
MGKLILKKKIATRILNGHPWIFGNEVEKIEGSPEPGGIVEVFYHDGKFAGSGYFNQQSQIITRLLSRDRGVKINEEFFLKKLKDCWSYRQKIGYTENCRLVFGEADGLPQLIIDKFNDYFVIQTLALGIDRWKPAIIKALQIIFQPKGIFERNDVPVRELEGLQQKDFYQSPLIQKS